MMKNMNMFQEYNILKSNLRLVTFIMPVFVRGGTEPGVTILWICERSCF
jgi:hypothetical protein